MASELLVNKITPESGTTLTLGDSGDTISFASGVLPSLESLTVTGDLTVDTNTLYVDSGNNRVGVGTASPSSLLDLGTSTGQKLLMYADGAIKYGMSIESLEYRIFSESNAIITLGHMDRTDGTTYTERMRIDSSGNVGIGTSSPSQALDVVGSIELSGSIYLGGTGAANALDDYEEGTWTADVYIGASSTGTTSTGYYTKIGNLVTYTVGQMNPSKGALTGDIEVRGLPFTAGNVSQKFVNGSMRWGGLNTGGTILTFILNNTTTITPQIYDTTSGYVDDLDNLNVSGASFFLYTTTGFYYTT